MNILFSEKEKLIVSQFWRLDIQNQCQQNDTPFKIGRGRILFLPWKKTSGCSAIFGIPWLLDASPQKMAIIPVYIHIIFPLCISVSVSQILFL